MSAEERSPEAVLEAWLAGEIGDDEAHEALAGAPDARAQLAELAELRAALDAEADAEQRATLEEARTESFPRGEELARRFMRERLQPPRRPRVPVAVAMAAAAAVLLFVWAPWRATPDRDEGPVVMGVGDLRDLQPCETTVETWGEFRWKAGLAANHFYRIDVFAADDPAGEPLTSEPRWTSESWRPSATDVERWPSRIVWRVRVVDSFGIVVAEESCNVSLSQ